MPKFDEILFDRVAAVARRTGRKYAVMSRGAWSERIIRPVRNENNTQQFIGRIVDPAKPGIVGEEVVIGFYHPMFNGYTGKLSIVEVVDSRVTDLDIRYIARGRGIQAFGAMASCIGGEEVQQYPCADTPPCEGTTVWGGNPTTTALGTIDSTAIYDYDTMTHDMGPNEVPAFLSLPGYSGTPARPSFSRPLLLSWSPNHSAFQPTFQPCSQLACPGGSGQLEWQCCIMVLSWEALYGPDWCSIVKQMIEDGEIIFTGDWLQCSWLRDWILANC